MACGGDQLFDVAGPAAGGRTRACGWRGASRARPRCPPARSKGAPRGSGCARGARPAPLAGLARALRPPRRAG
eukprot:11182768-Lingulodinium_polyedra.AAC.1